MLLSMTMTDFGNDETVAAVEYEDIATVSTKGYSAEEIMGLCKKPQTFHPPRNYTYPQKMQSGAMRGFVSDYFNKYPELAFSYSTKSVYCATCFFYRRPDAKGVQLHPLAKYE